MSTQSKSFADKISAAYEAGCTIRDIAGDEGRSYAAIRDLLLRNGVQLRGRGGDTRSDLLAEIERQQLALDGAGQHIGRVLADNERLTGRLRAIANAHRKHNCDGNTPEDCGCVDDRAESPTGEVCGHCRWPWPCQTSEHVRAALGEAEGEVPQ